MPVGVLIGIICGGWLLALVCLVALGHAAAKADIHDGAARDQWQLERAHARWKLTRDRYRSQR